MSSKKSQIKKNPSITDSHEGMFLKINPHELSGTCNVRVLKNEKLNSSSSYIWTRIKELFSK